MGAFLNRLYDFQDRFERRHPFLAGLITFLLASAMVALTVLAFLMLVVILEACGVIIK